LVHAAGETGPAKTGTHAVVLAAKNEDHLARIVCDLEAASIPYKPIHEPDSPWDGALMAIGIPPMDRTNTRKMLSKLPLLK